MRSPRSLRTTAILLTSASAAMWGGVIAAFWMPVPEKDVDALVAVAPTLTVLAVIFWLTAGNRRRQDGQGLALRTLADVIRPAARHVTGPLRRVK